MPRDLDGLTLEHGPDGLCCHLRVGDGVAHPVDAAALHAWICAQGVPEALVDDEALAVAAEAIRRGDGVDAVVAVGRRVHHGSDATVEIEVFDAWEPPSQERIDLRERGQQRAVTSDQLLARVHFETAGVDGLSTQGVVSAARPGRPLELTFGDGVTVAEDGEVRATLDGTAVFLDGHLSVVDVYRVHGDVDYDTGHVRLDHGSVTVDRGVQPGFCVTCPGDVLVKGDVEGATVTAGGDIVVQGVFVGGASGRLEAGGRIKVTRVSGGRICAGADVEIGSEAYEAEIEAGGVLRVSGRLLGGIARAGRGAQVGVLGTPI